MAMLMLTLRLRPDEANLAAVQQKLDLAADEIDPEFGVVSLDPSTQLYAVLVEEAAAQRVRDAAVGGPFANPRIDAFDLPPP